MQLLENTSLHVAYSYTLV